MGLKERAIQAFRDARNSEDARNNKVCEESKEAFKELFGEYPERIDNGKIFLGGCKFGVNKTVSAGADIITKYEFFWIRDCVKCNREFAFSKIFALSELGFILDKDEKFICHDCSGEGRF